ncbi:MAG: class I SAM-dependent methyltransferase [Roseovarius sp.]|nr:class I SAM-dependent methyltransferase [Roseovarius sp.]
MTAFDTGYSGLYDTMYKTKDYSAECDLVEAAFARVTEVKPSRILDIGCGSGKHALEMTARGYGVVGVDPSTSMLEQAARNAAALSAGDRPVWVQGDARDFKAEGQFDGAVMMFAVLGYLNSNADVLAGLQRIRKHLEPGAPFICDFWYGPAVLTLRPEDRVRELPLEDGTALRAVHTDLDTTNHLAQVNFDIWVMRKGKETEKTSETHVMRYFFPREIELFLETAGFRLKSLTAFPDLDAELSDATWNALAVAEAI